MAKSPDTITVTFYPTRPVNDQLDKLAAANRRSKAMQVLVIIEAYLARLAAEEAEAELEGQNGKAAK